ncbi:MAG TPA: protein-disulfide reductase DsbD domain-containing protein [Sphingobium sp.]|nr:protein-disulfide reductase DsbD domain-containing protein [Sphingobium sp.]
MRGFDFLLMTLLCVLASWSGASRAQMPLPASHIRAELVAESVEPAPGSSVTLAIRMVPEAGWHGYWLNPGDAGLGVEADWTVPSGFSVGPLRYPVPTRLLIAGLMNHVFEGPYALLADLRVPERARPGDPLPVRLAARWLACTDKVCVPERATLSIGLTVGSGRINPEDQRRFDGYRAALPRPLGSAAHYMSESGKLRIAIPYPAAAPVDDPWFYAATKDAIRYAEPQKVRRNGDFLIIETKGDPARGSAIEGVLAVSPQTALSLAARPGPVPSGGFAVSGDSAPVGLVSFALTLGGALLGGLLLNIMPCVLPILSLKAIALSRAGGDEREARVEAIAYTLGIMLACLVLGGLILGLRAAGHSVGWAFQLQDERVIALLLVLMVAITFNLAGIFALPALDAGRQGNGARGAFLTGTLAAFVATPCTGPFMAVAMGAALLMPWPLALTIFAGLGLGLAAPFLALAFVPALRRRLPRPGPWMERLRRIMAVPMGLTALALAWLLWRQGGTGGVTLAIILAVATALLCLIAGRIQRGGRGAGSIGLAGAALLSGAALLVPPALTATVQDAAADGAIPYGAAQLASLRAERRPVFLYFTADWCVTCKINEAGAIADTDVAQAFARQNVAVMVGDWTRGDPAITRFLEAHGRSGVPLYLYYAPGAATGQVLPQLLTPGSLTALVGA